jgi:RNA polymerase sigma factor (sigma-70 family)
MPPNEICQLVRRAAQGDQAAWNAIVDEYASLLWSVVRGFRLGEAQAADAVQTTWLRLVEHLAEIRDPERLPGWLRTTARRTCLEILRAARAERPVDSADEQAVAPWSRGADPGDGDPESCTLRQEREFLVRRALAGLSERHRTLLELLVASPPVSYEEIGARLGMPVGSIGPTRARILARLRESLTAEGLSDLALA